MNEDMFFFIQFFLNVFIYFCQCIAVAQKKKRQKVDNEIESYLQ